MSQEQEFSCPFCFAILHHLNVGEILESFNDRELERVFENHLKHSKGATT